MNVAMTFVSLALIGENIWETIVNAFFYHRQHPFYQRQHLLHHRPHLFFSEKAGRKVLMLSGLSLMIGMTILLLASLLTFVSQDQTIIMITVMINK